jgi:hypothetical protein
MERHIVTTMVRLKSLAKAEIEVRCTFFIAVHARPKAHLNEIRGEVGSPCALKPMEEC